MDGELARTVSDILNSASSGVGDISQWVASSGLPQYVRVQVVNGVVGVVLSLIALAAVVVAAVMVTKKAKSDYDFEDLAVIFYILLALVGVVCFIWFGCNVQGLIQWSVNPDGMLLNTLIKAVG